MLYMNGKLYRSTFRFTNNITLFKKKCQDTCFNVPVHCQGLSAACNECHFLDFDILVIYHFKSAYLRFYWRYLNNVCFVRNLISSSKIWLKNLIFWKMLHEPHFDRAPHIFSGRLFAKLVRVPEERNEENNVLQTWIESCSSKAKNTLARSSAFKINIDYHLPFII